MERQIQKPGVRQWFAGHLLAMQNELYRAIGQGVLGDIGGNVLLSGGAQQTSLSHNGRTRYKIGHALALIQGKLCLFDGTYIEQARLNNYDKTTAPANQNHFFFKKVKREEGLALYQNNQRLPTIEVVGMEISASTGADTVKVERHQFNTPTSRLVLPPITMPIVSCGA